MTNASCTAPASADHSKIRALLDKTLENNASDLHLTLNFAPFMRVDGELFCIGGEAMCAADLEAILMPLLSERQRKVLEEKSSVDLAYAYDADHRFRVNIFYQRSALAAVFRKLPSLKLTLEALGMPVGINSFSELKDGLVLVTGPTGSGKSTTLAAIIDKINRNKSCHIITIEDPVEFVHFNIKSLVTQRELFTDVPSFSLALRDSLREDPDVILVGEMRDLDTMRTAIMAAETGHLVFSTLHSRDAISSLTRMIGVFSIEEQAQIRHQLSATLRGVVSQRLLRHVNGEGRVAAVEVMKVTSAISNLIRSGKLERIYSAIETGGKLGMQTMELSLADLYKDGKIDRESAIRMAKNETIILPRLERIDA
ncbi:MAG: type IV pilus twitching motility protein PilT [Oceanidesulfovibrio sp.]